MDEVEALARRIAADKMLLRVDVHGKRLPASIWTLMVGQALTELDGIKGGPEEWPAWLEKDPRA